MNNFLKVTAVASLFALSAGANAAVTTVGVATWDPSIEPIDFSADASINQWFTSDINGNMGLLTTEAGYVDGFENVVTVNDSGTNVVGSYLSGAGTYTTINDDQASDGTTLQSIASGTELSYAFGGLLAKADGTLDTSASWIKVYSDTSRDFFANDLFNKGQEEYVDALDGDLWLSGKFLELELNVSGTAAFVSSTGVGLIELLDGDALGYFDVFGQTADGLDYHLTTEATASFINTSITGQDQIAKATVTVKGETVNIPEPASLALLGLGLLGFATRRKA